MLMTKYLAQTAAKKRPCPTAHSGQSPAGIYQQPSVLAVAVEQIHCSTGLGKWTWDTNGWKLYIEKYI